MSRRNKRLLSDPFSETDDLSKLFGDLYLSNTNTQPTTNMEAIVQELQTQMAALVATNANLNEKLARVETAQAALQRPTPVTVAEYTDIVPTYTSGDNIQLDAFKVIHEFNGDKKVYRSWRTQVSKMMQQITAYKTHPKYAAALAIIRAKITGVASDILINNNTAHNIDAIIDRLDFSYADQRPLYVIEAEMTTKKQGTKTLQEFYDDINQALNMVITKITMTYKEPAEQKSLISETQSKAIRTFVTGLNGQIIRTTLYGSMPKTLSEAFAIAQTIQYDNQHMHLEHAANEQQRNAKKFRDERSNMFNPNFRYTTNHATKPNFSATPQINQQQQPKPTPMDIDNSRQYVQRNQPADFKRPREPSFQHANRPQASFQHVNKQQRMHHINETGDIQSVYDDSLENNYDGEGDDHQSTTSERESVFLEE